MFLTKRRVIISLAILASFGPISIYAKENTMKNTTTLCFGRFLIDLPDGVKIRELGQQAEFMFGPIKSELFASGEEEFSKKMKERVSELKLINENSGRALKDYFLLPDNTYIFTTAKKIYGEYDFSFDAYKLDHNILFSMSQKNFDEDIFQNKVIGKLKNILLPNLRLRLSDEIPSDPGFCIKDGFIADDGNTEHFEEARLQINLKEWPDVWISIYSQTVPKAGDESLLQRLDKHPDTILEKTYIKTFRRGKHEVNGLKGEEILDLLPTGEGIKQHFFHWEAIGVVNSIFAPLLDLEFESAVLPLKGPRPRPSLTDEQAITLYDNIVNSIRLRPTTVPVKTGDKQSPKTPLGELAATGRNCPQTGWWQSVDAKVATSSSRQHFKAGEVMPKATQFGEPGIWQKLKGQRPVHPLPTLWKLVAYGEEEQAAPAENPASGNGTGKDAERPNEG